MSRQISLGDRFGHLTVETQLRCDASGRPRYMTRCACGTLKNFSYRRLLAGKTTHCGCKNTTDSERLRERVLDALKGIGEATTATLATYLGDTTTLGLRGVLVVLRREGKLLSSVTHKGHVWSLAPVAPQQFASEIAGEHYSWVEQSRHDKRLRDIMRSRV